MTPRIDQLDLKMLRVLLTLAHTRNTYRAADQLHLSQSAVSRSLGRLREVLGDPLFVRGSRGLEPTELTERIAARLPEIFDLITEVVEGDGQFDPRDWQGNASIALSSLVTRCWGEALYSALSQLAPNVVWNFHTWRASTVPEILDGRVVMGVHIENEHWPQSLYQQPLVEDGYVLMARRGHRALRAKPGMELFTRYSLISLLLPDWNDYDNRLEAAIRGQGIQPRVSLRTDNMHLALDSLRNGDSLMAGTRALADGLDDIDCLGLPEEIEQPGSTLMLCYPRRSRNSPRYRWLWEQVRGVLAAGGVGAEQPLPDGSGRD